MRSKRLESTLFGNTLAISVFLFALAACGEDSVIDGSSASADAA